MQQPDAEDGLGIVSEEERLLRRVQRSLESFGRGRSTQAAPRPDLRALRDEVLESSEDDLPSALHDLAAAQSLSGRATRQAPDVASPYFAHLRVRTARGERDYLLGRASYADPANDVRIVDWRFAPVARIFYGYDEGEAFEESLPGGLLEGEVVARRVVVIERGRLTRVLAGARAWTLDPDNRWLQDRLSELSGGSGAAARPGCLGVGAGARGRAARALDVTALLDTDQYAAVHAPASRPLLVLGSAGSGKTTVALHRLARLALEGETQGAMRVVVPEEGLARLSKRLLAPLGLHDARVATLGAWLVRSAKLAFGAGKVRVSPETPALVARLKRHPALRGPLRDRLGRLKPARSLARLRRRLADLFTDRAFLGEVVRAARGDLPSTAIEETVRHTMLQLATPLAKEYAGFAPESLVTLDGRSLEEATPDALAGTLDLEDLALLLFLRAGAGGIRRLELAHLVLDEAEDFSLFELHVLGRQLGAARGLTLAGDELQQTGAGFAGWSEALSALGAEDAATCRLQTSYRCPRPVVELARRVLGGQAPEREAKAAREGAPVGLHSFPEQAHAQLFLAGALRDLSDREPEASVGVVAATRESAREVHRALSALPSARLVLDGAFTFEPGIDVTDVDSVKGLEFDYVVIPDATALAYPDDKEARRRLHVAITRAAHQVWVVWSGPGSPLIA